MNMRFFLSFLAAALLFCSCVSNRPDTGDPVPLTEEEIAFLQKLRDPKTASVIEDVPELFFNLNQMLHTWQTSYSGKTSKKNLRIYTSLESMLTRRVYLNFDKILDQLENGVQPNRVIAAAALGFSRIPDSTDYPQVYPRAIEALLRALRSGDDAVTQNALLGLRVLADPDTPLEGILPLLTQHHNPTVRANAALCLSAIVSPSQADLVTPYVLPALRDEEPKVRNHAVSIMGVLKDPSGLVPIMELLADRYELIRANAARTLGELGDPAACGALILQLDHPKEIVRVCCHESLKKLSGKDYGFDQERWNEWWADYLGRGG